MLLLPNIYALVVADSVIIPYNFSTREDAKYPGALAGTTGNFFSKSLRWFKFHTTSSGTLQRKRKSIYSFYPKKYQENRRAENPVLHKGEHIKNIDFDNNSCVGNFPWFLDSD